MIIKPTIGALILNSYPFLLDRGRHKKSQRDVPRGELEEDRGELAFIVPWKLGVVRWVDGRRGER